MSRFSTSFARATTLRDRAFGVSAQYRHGDDVLDVTLRLGSRDLGPKNTLGSEFAHVAVKEFQIAAAALAIDGTVFSPTAGDEIAWTDPQNVLQTWTVFPVWNDRPAEFLDNAETDWRVFAVSGNDLVEATYKPPAGDKSFKWNVIVSKQRGHEAWGLNGDVLKQSSFQVTGATPPLVAQGIDGLQRNATIEIAGVERAIDIGRSLWSLSRVVLELISEEIGRHEEMEQHATLR